MAGIIQHSDFIPFLQQSILNRGIKIFAIIISITIWVVNKLTY